MFDLMDESRISGRGSIAWKLFRRTIVTWNSMQASSVLQRSRTVRKASVGLLVRI